MCESTHLLYTFVSNNDLLHNSLFLSNIADSIITALLGIRKIQSSLSAIGCVSSTKFLKILVVIEFLSSFFSHTYHISAVSFGDSIFYSLRKP